jgi:membrane protease YdiL (CAAX protease family)
MDLKAWLVSTKGVVITAVMLTLIVLAESIFPPWAPFFIIYAILALVIPVALKTYRFGSFKKVISSFWLIIILFTVIDLLWDPGVMGYIYGKFLENFGLSDNPFYSVDAASSALFAKIEQQHGISFTTAEILFSFFIILWAPFGEEFFYRGYMFGTLRQSKKFWTASLISSAFFGLRHATHFFYLLPNVPFVSAGIWAFSAFVSGLLLNYIYEKTGSLYACIAVHLLINIFWIFSII